MLDQNQNLMNINKNIKSEINHKSGSLSPRGSRKSARIKKRVTNQLKTINLKNQKAKETEVKAQDKPFGQPLQGGVNEQQFNQYMMA